MHTQLFFHFLAFFYFLSFPLSAQENWQNLSDKGTEAFYASQFQTAVEYFKKAIIQAEKEFGKDHPNYVTSCTDLADSYRSLGLYLQAEPLYLYSKKTIDATTGEAHPYYTTNRIGLAELYQLQGKYELAEPLYIEAKNIEEKNLGKNHPDYAIACNNLAYLYNELGEFPKAEKLFVESLKIREKALGKSHPDYAQSCNNLASLYLYQGLDAKAEPLFLEAKTIDENVLGKNHPAYATDCNNLAVLYFQQKLYVQAEPLYTEAKNIQEKTLGKEHPLYATACNNLSFLNLMQGKLEDAKRFCVEAKNIREKALGKNHLLYAQSCMNLGIIYFKQKLYSQAEPLLLEAKVIVEKSLGKNHPLYALACNHLARMFAKQALYSQAEPLYQEVIKNKIQQIQSLLPTLSEIERKAFLQDIDIFFEDFYVFATAYYATKPSIAAEVFQLQLIRKGLLFQSTQKIQNQILKSGNPTLIAQYKDWKAKRAYLSKLLQLSIAEKEKQGITPEIEKQLTTEANEIERQLSQSSELFTKAIDKKTYTWQDIQQQLKKGESLVEMIRISQGDTVSQIKYIALIITPQTQNYPQILLLENGDELENRYLNYYRNGIKFQKEDKYSYEQYLSRLKVETFKRVYFSPDGVYHQVNLLTLRNPKTGKYLADETDIRLISNPKDLITFAQKPIKQAKNFKNYQLHLFGFPQYSNDVEGLPADSLQKEKKRTLNLSGNRIESGSTVRFLGEGGKINLLPGTKTEVENIQKTAQIQNIKTQMYLRQDATEENINQLQNPDFLHIATHGFFLANLPEADEGERGFTGIETKKYIQNPLLRCGLLFAGAENSLTPNEKSNNTNNSSGNLGDEDGILTADEAMNLYLDKTDLVVLSACETGLGEISNGEGVYGLQRAFQQAGAKTVLMSLWTVSDEATQEIMSLFYQNLFTKKQDKRTAFRNAQKTLKTKYPQPYFWGAFVMVGE